MTEEPLSTLMKLLIISMPRSGPIVMINMLSYLAGAYTILFLLPEAKAIRFLATMSAYIFKGKADFSSFALVNETSPKQKIFS